MANATQERVTRYYPIKNRNGKATHLKAEIYYALGGHNVFTYKNESRGYYISVSPVERSDKYGYMMESYTAFTGLKQCVLEVQRKSAKKLAEAIEYFDAHVDEFITNYFSEFEVDLNEYEVR